MEDHINEWANMTGFLLALGGVCLPKKSPAAGNIRASAIAAAAAAAAAAGQDPTGKKGVGVAGMAGGMGASAPMLQMAMAPHGSTPDLQYCTITLENFLGQLLKLLVCQNEKFGPSIQKHVKELVGHEMSPLLYPILFDQIKQIVETFFDAAGQVIVNETNTQFIDHIIFIMRNVLESKPDQGHQTPQETNLGQTSIETMMLTIVRYVRHLDTTVLAIHIKTRLCLLVETMMKRRDDLSFRQEMKFRNKLVEYLTDWAISNSHQIAPPGSGDVTALTRELDEACMHAVAALLQNLPLQSEESDRGDLVRPFV